MNHLDTQVVGRSFDVKTLTKLRNSLVQCWNDRGQRRKLIHRLATLAKYSKWSAPHFHEVFQREEIELLLTDASQDTLPALEQEKPDDDDWACMAETFIQFVARRTQFKDEPELDEAGKPVPRRTTPIHHAARGLYGGYGYRAIPELFKIYNRLDVNYVDEESDLTHFHAACMTGCEDVVRQFLEHGQDANLRSLTHDPPLHMALGRGHDGVAELLLRAGADPNLTSPVERIAPLHLVHGVDELLGFLDICDEMQQTVLIDARNRRGATPLHCALAADDASMAEVLLRRGANPNQGDVDGLTPLHYVATYSRGVHVAATFFRVCEEMDWPVCIDARDQEGCTPLHLALNYGKPDLVRFLLERGADPCLADEEGMTPLHVICSRDNVNDDDDSKGDNDDSKDDNDDSKDDNDDVACEENKLVEMFFDACEAAARPVRVDAKDKLGRTPLQWAVATLKPNTIDVLLDHGANLSEFVFPSQGSFPEIFAEDGSDTANRLDDAFEVIGKLHARGCELHIIDVETFTGHFARYGLPKQSVDTVKSKLPKEYDDITERMKKMRLRMMMKRRAIAEDYLSKTTERLELGEK